MGAKGDDELETNREFYTQKGYQRQHGGLTETMEDYLEMICRCEEDTGYVRMQRLAERLHVQPSSASKMASKLRALGYLEFEKYGLVTMTEKGRALGQALRRRHDILHRFFCLVNGTTDELEQVEQVEHFIHPETVDNLERLTRRLEEEKP